MVGHSRPAHARRWDRIAQVLIQDIDETFTVTPSLWWLGEAGFVVRFANITFYVDPCFTALSQETIRHADMLLATHAGAVLADAPSILRTLEGSRAAKLILPRSTADAVHAAGVPYPRMSTTDAGLRIEYFKDNLYGRVYAVPSALDRTAAGGHPKLGYLIRFGRWTIFHAGDCALYPELAARLRPYNVTVALLPIGQNNFSPSDAAQLAVDIEAKWVVPMQYGKFSEERESEFVAHMLGHRPELRFRVFQVGEKWTVPEE